MDTCPHCRAQLADAPELAGSMVQCPFCGFAFVLPGVVVQPTVRRPRPKGDPVLAYLFAGIIIAAVAFVVSMVVLDEIRLWRAERALEKHKQEIQRELDKFDKAFNP